MSGEVRPLLRLAVPLIIGQVGQMSLHVADTVMVGKLGQTELAALTFGNNLFYVPFVFGIGVLTCVSVRTSNARGAGDSAVARATCRHGWMIALMLGLLLFGMALAVAPHLAIFGQTAEITARAPKFFLLIMASLIPALISTALKNHGDALNRPWPSFWISLVGVALNIGLGIVLIFGKLGIGPMGLEGAGWATLIARWAIVGGMLLWMRGTISLRDWMPQVWIRKPDFKEIKHLLGIGLPASFQMTSEVTAFSTAGLLVGHFGETALAAHQVSLMCAATAFMVPLGLSMALTVRMGEAHGANAIHRLKVIARTGLMLATTTTALTALLFLVAGSALASWMVQDAAVIATAASFLVIVGVFQISDGVQVASASMLRGLQDVRLPGILAFSAYWLIGLPIELWLGFHTSLGPRGVWWGLALGLTMAAVALTVRLYARIRVIERHQASVAMTEVT